MDVVRIMKNSEGSFFLKKDGASQKGINFPSRKIKNELRNIIESSSKIGINN